MIRQVVLSILAAACVLSLVACNTTAPSTPVAPTSAAATPTTAAPPATDTSAPATNTTAPATSLPPTAVPPSAVPATAPPTGAPSTGVRLVVQDPVTYSIQIMMPDGTVQPRYQANSQVDLLSIFPPGNVARETVYLPITGQPGQVVGLGPTSGNEAIPIVKMPVYGLAATTRALAWGSADLSGANVTATILTAAPQGSSQGTAIYTEKFTTPHVLRVFRWSNDGRQVLFGKEPIGLGGYILFSGLTNLWSLDPVTGQATELLHEPTPKAAICIDDLSADQSKAADHCKIDAMQVTDLKSKKVTPIAIPAGVTGFGRVGGARFSPDGSRLAFGLAKGNPDGEQGWVAIADVASGKSTLVATSPAGDYFQVVAWLDPNTLVLQSSGAKAGIWLVGTDGKNLHRLGDGLFLGLLGSGGTAGVDCGEITTLGPNPPQDPQASAALSCFAQAYLQCQPATLTFTVRGVDAGTTHVFALSNSGGACRIQDTFSSYVVPLRTPSPQTVACSGLVFQSGGLTLKGCGEAGDIVIPAPDR